LIGCGLIAAEHPTDIRAVDFSNFVYPWQEAELVGDLQWLNSFKASILLRDGEHVFSGGDQSQRMCPYLAVQQITYEDVDNDGLQDAIVTLSYHSCGTAHWNYVYIYTLDDGKPKLLAAFQTGARVYHGLHRIYVGNGYLTIELNEPIENEGDCCATWCSRTQYEWRDNHFQKVSKPVVEWIPVYERTWYTAR
jgi:hypothetical protein